MIPFVDLPARHRPLARTYAQLFSQTVSAGSFILGKHVTDFETALARTVKARFAIGVSNGTDALIVSLRALSIGPGDEVIIPDFTFISTAFAVLLVGATPILTDIDPKTLTMDPQNVKRAISRRTKAIIPVHLYGLPADMDSICTIAAHRRIAVIEDAAQALGSVYKTKHAGAIGDIGCFSFYPSKNIGALGDGGAITTNNPAIARRIRTMINIGSEKKYHHTILGGNNRLDTLQAVFLSAQLPRLRAWNAARKRHAALYTALLRDLPITLPPAIPGYTSNTHLFVIRTKKRAQLINHLAKHGIETGIHYPYALHEQPSLAGLGHTPGQFPVSCRAAREALSLPMYPELTKQQIRAVARAVRSYFYP